jgi:hypothetical protein
MAALIRILRFQINDRPAKAPCCAYARRVPMRADWRRAMSSSEDPKYPLLHAILAGQELPLKPMYTNRDVAKIFKVCVRAIQNWISAGRLIPRDLPGRWKFLPQDLEEFLRASRKGDR